MNKSVEYIKNRIINNPDIVSQMPINGWNKSVIINPMERYLQLLPTLESCFVDNNKFLINTRCDLGKTNITIEYDKDAEFDYFTMETTTHDGTMLFTEQCIEKLLYKLFQIGTYAKNKVTSDFIENPFNYDIFYTIGDIVLHRDFGMKNINGHNWSGQTDIVVLPIKFECVSR